MSATASHLWSGLVTLAAVLCGCSGAHNASAKQDSAEYFLITVNTRVPYWQTAAAGFVKAASELQVKANVAGPENYDANSEQQEFKRVVGLRPAGIMVSPANPDLLKADIDAAVVAGIPVLTVDADAPTSKRLTFVGTDNYQAGRMGGEILSRALAGNGSVVVFTMPQQANLEERYRGYMEIIAAYPHITVLPVVDIKGDPQVAQEQTDKLLGSQKSVSAFVCLEALACKGVAKALSARQVSGKVVIAMDSDPETIEWIRKGMIMGTLVQKPFTMGFVGLKMLDDLHRHPPRSFSVAWADDPFAPGPSFVNTGVMWVDQHNVDKLARESSQP